MPTSPTNNLHSLQRWLPLIVAGVAAIGMLVGYQMRVDEPLISIHRAGEEDLDFLPALVDGKLEEILRYIEARYVDETDKDALTEETINYMLQQLDPHSVYISAAELNQVNEDLEGEFEGIGVEFIIIQDTLHVVSALAGSPSEQAGILANDKFVTVDDTLIAGKKLGTEGIIELLRGKKGTHVRIGVLRGNSSALQYFNVKRDKIPLHSIDVVNMLNDHTGYIKINRFSDDTYREFMEGVENLITKKGMKDLVIDVRQNPGGYLNEATNILSQLFPDKGKLLVYTEGRNAKKSEYETTGSPFFEIRNIAILIDEGSASASEILAGAIQDWDRGIVVGRRSYGKGLVQEQFDLNDGSALRLTVARYFTPSGRCIQRTYKGNNAYDEEAELRYQHGELLSADSIAIKDTTKYYTAKGRIVYGGGGITPDYFVPLDTSVFNANFFNIRQQLPEFAFNYFQPQKAAWTQKYKDATRFSDDFTVNDALLEAFLNTAQPKGTHHRTPLSEAARRELKNLLKARFARLLFKEDGFYTVYNQTDRAVQTALQHLGTPLKKKK